jgi:glutaredoxin-related protein
VQPKIEGFHADVISRVAEAIRSHAIVVVGMAQNPHVRRARRVLEAAGLAFEYIEYGSYLSAWAPRLAIKMWSGWPTFPQVFVDGTLVGGADQITKAIEDGTVRRMLDARSAAA